MLKVILGRTKTKNGENPLSSPTAFSQAFLFPLCDIPMQTWSSCSVKGFLIYEPCSHSVIEDYHCSSFPEVFLMYIVSLGSGVIFPLIFSFLDLFLSLQYVWGSSKLGEIIDSEQILDDLLGRRNIPSCPSLSPCGLDSHMALYSTENKTSCGVLISLNTNNEESLNISPRKTTLPPRAKCTILINIADLNRKVLFQRIFWV